MDSYRTPILPCLWPSPTVWMEYACFTLFQPFISSQIVSFAFINHESKHHSIQHSDTNKKREIILQDGFAYTGILKIMVLLLLYYNFVVNSFIIIEDGILDFLLTVCKKDLWRKTAWKDRFWYLYKNVNV